MAVPPRTPSWHDGGSIERSGSQLCAAAFQSLGSCANGRPGMDADAPSRQRRLIVTDPMNPPITSNTAMQEKPKINLVLNFIFFMN